mgnify:CR=1 FL=1
MGEGNGGAEKRGAGGSGGSQQGRGNGALGSANEIFHEAYKGARDGVQQEVPVLVVLPSELVLHYRGERYPLPYTRTAIEGA